MKIREFKTFGGTNYIQTNKGKKSLVLLTKAKATLLPHLLVWDKELLTTKPVIDLVPLIRWPMTERGLASWVITLYTIAEFPSKIRVGNTNFYCELYHPFSYQHFHHNHKQRHRYFFEHSSQDLTLIITNYDPNTSFVSIFENIYIVISFELMSSMRFLLHQDWMRLWKVNTIFSIPNKKERIWLERYQRA